MNQTKPRAARRPLAAALLALSALAALPLLQAAARPAAPDSRVVILGFDGADGRTVEELMDAGELPNLRRLREQGSFARLGTSVPNESPTSWASLNTGQNPGKTAISGFVKRTFNSKRLPVAGLGFLDTSDERAIDEYEDLPLPPWSPWMLGGLAGGGTLAVFLIVFGVLLRMRMAVAAPIALVLAVVAGYVGFQARGLLPSKIPRTGNPNQARNLWDYAGDAGVQSIVLEAAQAFDMPAPDGTRVLSGLGVPDARGAIGDWFIYTDDPTLLKGPPEGERTSTAGTKYRVDWPRGGGAIRTKIYGPVNFCETDRVEQELARVRERQDDPKLGYKESVELNGRRSDLEDELRRLRTERTSVDLVVDKRGPDSAAVRVGDQEQVLTVGGWSDYYHLTFPLNAVLAVKAVTRVKLMSLEEPFKLFVNTIDIDPEHPPFWQPISAPHGFAPELVKSSGGTFETYGWACTTMPFKDGEIDPETLLEDVEFTMAWRERLTYAQIRRSDWRLFMSVFSTTDRIQHMMYQYYDTGHPLYDPAEASRKVSFFGKELPLSQTIPEIYRQMDRIVGEVMDKHLGPDDTLLVCSDHGFQSFRRQVSLNNWLVEKGYLVLREGATRNDFIDWSRTQAYAMGLGFIYVNQRDREGRGIVSADEKEALLDRIQADLVASIDPDTGLAPVAESYRIAREHSGAHLADAPDLVLGFAPTYRVAWTTTGLGINLEEDENGRTINGRTYTDNTSPWSGGHPSVARDHVRGVFLSNQRFVLPEGGPNLLHIAPTALALLGVPVPAEMDLAPLPLAK